MKKYLGQHSLINKNAIKKIIDTLDIKSGDKIVEIGPGRGALTFELAKSGAKVIAIEKDEELVNQLISQLVNWKNIEIINGDALKLINQLTNQLINCKLVGNIPYYITGRLLRILSELEKKPELIILTIQREVAERMVARPPKMNLLAAITQFWAKTEIIDYLKPEYFNPVPQVNSAIIKFTPINLSSSEDHKLKAYFKFVKILFKQPRKTILNNLRDGFGLPKEEILKILEKNKISENERGQNLDIDRIEKLSRSFNRED